jgi:hypothetical protein
MNKTLAALTLLTASFGAHAEIYKHVDADGHVTYSNVPMKGATKLNLEPAVSGSGTSSGKSGKASATPTPADFPKVEKAEQKQRDDKRRQILEEELAAERKALEDAKKNLAEGETDPEVFKTTVMGKDGKPQVVTRRNVAKYQEKMTKLQDDVSLHEKNIELLEKELGSLK